jgi:hypothetical protein
VKDIDWTGWAIICMALALTCWVVLAIIGEIARYITWIKWAFA